MLDFQQIVQIRTELSILIEATVKHSMMTGFDLGNYHHVVGSLYTVDSLFGNIE